MGVDAKKAGTLVVAEGIAIETQATDIAFSNDENQSLRPRIAHRLGHGFVECEDFTKGSLTFVLRS